jgi:hypothetical protein
VPTKPVKKRAVRARIEVPVKKSNPLRVSGSIKEVSSLINSLKLFSWEGGRAVVSFVALGK